MDYCIVLYFDKDSEEFIFNKMKEICCAGANSYMLDVGIKPHITLSIFKETAVNETTMWLRSVAKKLEKFEIGLCNIGMFTSNISTLFLAPVIKADFISLHTILNEQVKEFASGFESFYLPGNWVPHCTLVTRMSQDELHRALDTTIKGFKPFSAKVTRIGFIQCYPLTEIAEFDLAGQ